MSLLEQYIEELFDEKNSRLERYRQAESVDPVRAEAARAVLFHRFCEGVALAEES